jgi:site-specific recombinase XerD
MTETTLTTDCIDPFQRWLYEKGRSPNTIKAYSTDVRMLFLELELTSFQELELPLLTARWMNQTKRVKSAKTLRRRLTALRELSCYLGLDPLLPKFNLPNPGKSDPHPLPNLLKDLEALIANCKNDNQRCLIALLGYEGMRMCEALGITPDNVDIKEGTITVWGKGDKKRVIPLTTRAEEFILPRVITARIKNLPTLVEYSDRGARYFVTELGAKACISRPIASHDLRATFATLAYVQTKDGAAVQAWLGHESFDTTRGYIEVALPAMRLAGNF